MSKRRKTGKRARIWLVDMDFFYMKFCRMSRTVRVTILS
jgi:hypothetical protein